MKAENGTKSRKALLSETLDAGRGTTVEQPEEISKKSRAILRYTEAVP
jgi:hypothetical protein